MPVEFEPFDISEYMDSEERIAGVLAAAAEDDDPNVLLGALMHAAKARGMIDVAKAAGLNRESLYKALRPGAHPRFETVQAVLRALGVKLTVSSRATSEVVVAGRIVDLGEITSSSVTKAVVREVGQVVIGPMMGGRVVEAITGSQVVSAMDVKEEIAAETEAPPRRGRKPKTSGEPGGARKTGRTGGAAHRT
jgi:probable addiction module antidote protein